MPSFFFHLSLDLYPPPDFLYYGGFLQPLLGDIFRDPIVPSTLETVKGRESRLANNLGLHESAPVNSSRDGFRKDSSSVLDAHRSEPSLPAKPPSIAQDWRYDKISIQKSAMLSREMESTKGTQSTKTHAKGSLEGGLGGSAIKGRYEPADWESEDLGWGVVRLFRDAEETPGLHEDITINKGSKHGRYSSKRGDIGKPPVFHDEDCTTVCILAVPSYLDPADFLGFVGEKTREDVSHFRMIRTEKANRYMVLMRFRNGKKAREWRQAWNGKPFNNVEPENCHAVFIKSIEFRAAVSEDREPSFPDMSNDPFTPPASKTATSTSASTIVPVSLQSTHLSTKPPAPPTPALIELPTCPVCLERMDESTGLMTIQCQHVFHCTCLQKWRGSGCPVCRYTQEDLSKRAHDGGKEHGLNECSICRSDTNLWVCLICGNVGCGRYDAAHAFLHYQQSSHCFAMDLTNQRVWDYESDAYVHRLIQNKADGKLVELPSAIGDTAGSDWDGEDFVPREKLENIGAEYTHLLTSQLESQRMYFEEKVERAADKASEATSVASKATESASNALQKLSVLQIRYDSMIKEIVPALERDNDRAKRRAEKFEAMARKFEKEWREEKAMNESLMERIEFMNNEVKSLIGTNQDLQEQNRDLSFFISGQEKLKNAGEEVQEGVVSVPDPPLPKKKGKGKNK